MKRSSLLLAMGLPLAISAQQLVPCRTGDPALLQELHGGSPELMSAIEETNAELEEWTQQFQDGARSTYIVPVVFHIIHNYGPENITDEQVFDAMRILNEDFNRLNPDWDNVRPEFLDLVANIDVEFRLAHKDPDGNCTKGITRTVSALTNQGDNAMKALIQWPPNDYLNVWVCANANGAGGYTILPAAAEFFPERDGIVMNHMYVGSIGTGSVSRSRSLTHEAGHWINLEHTWGGSNTPGLAGNCSDDDNVDDTPNTIGWTVCDLDGATCGSPIDNVENFMEYAFCSKMFTLGQRARMIAALTSGIADRNHLITNGNLSATGVLQPVALCAVEFSADRQLVCAGDQVNFDDLSYNAVTSRDWAFDGGTPATSDEESPVVTYPNAGNFNVSLSASDGITSLTNSQDAYITVLPIPGLSVPIVEGFETTSSLNGPDWFTVNETGDNTFGLTSVAAYSGTKSVRIVNTAAMAGRTDELLSTTYDMSAATDITVSFRYAYAKRTSTDDDALGFYISNNCGATWNLRKIMRGTTNLTTGGVVTSSFIPSSGAQWGYAEVTNISATSNIPGFRFKFQFESDGGNNLYLDDININGGPVGVDELILVSDGVAVQPNPALDEAQAVVGVPQAGRVRVEVLDMTGRVVQAVHDGVLPAGAHRFELPIRALEAGAYFIRMQQGASQRVSRFVVR